MAENLKSSRLAGFHQKPLADRVDAVVHWAQLSADERALLHSGLSLAQSDKMIENVIGRYSLPLGIGTNFQINGRDYLIPMVVEEPSVVAAASHAAKLAREGGGFFTGSTAPIMSAQIQLLEVPEPDAAAAAIMAHEAQLLETANTSASIAERGGGPQSIRVRQLPDTSAGPMTIVHLLFDCRDAMGANAINTAAEAIASQLERLTGGRALLRILSNLADERRAWAEVFIPAASLATERQEGTEIAQAIVQANAFALADPYRATTHNKGILNGIDAVAVATGNDWRAIEAGAHAYAARDGQYRALTEWKIVEVADEERSSGGDLKGPGLYGRLELPLAVGTVGGATRSHPTARIALKILSVDGARELSEVMAAVGLAQNLAAVRALVSEGIQRGHMTLHARQIAVAAGAASADVERIASQLVCEGEIRVERAVELVKTTGGKEEQ